MTIEAETPTIEINGAMVPLTGPTEYVNAVVAWPVFQTWARDFDAAITVHAIDIHDVKMFGKHVGFAVVEADATRPDGTIIPGYGFLRGNAVGILLILESGLGPARKSGFVMVSQARLPAGKVLTETPAGIIEGDSVGGAAMKEIEEEIGIKVRESDLKELGVMYPSPGGCNEQIHLFSCRKWVSSHVFERLHGAQTGVAEENESITVQVLSLDEALASKDAKFLAAIALHNRDNLRM